MFNKERVNMLKKILIGFFAGILCGLFSSGGGMILVPSFIFFFKLNEKEARATSIFCILPMVLTTTFLYAKNQKIVWDNGIKIAIGGILGAVIGTKIIKRLDNKWLKLFFIVFLIYSTYKFLK